MPGVPLASAHGVRAWLAKARARIRWPEWVALISATILLVSMFFLTWFTVTRTSGGAGTKYFINDTVDGWHGATHLRWLLLLTIVMTLMLFTFQATRRAPVLPATFSLFVMLLAGASTIWLIFRVLIDPPAGRNLGGWVALICAALLTWAGYRSLRMEGIAEHDAPAEIPTVRLPERPTANPASSERS